MTEEERWRPSDGPARGPSTPPDLHFDPLATGLGVFFAVAIPIVVVGYTRPAGVNVMIIVVGVILGLLAGVIAGLWVDRRGGEVWKRSRL